MWHVCPKYNFSSFIEQIASWYWKYPFDWTHFDQCSGWISESVEEARHDLRLWRVDHWQCGRDHFFPNFLLSTLYHDTVFNRGNVFVHFLSPRLWVHVWMLFGGGWYTWGGQWLLVMTSLEQEWRLWHPIRFWQQLGGQITFAPCQKVFYPIRRPPHSKWICKCV